MDESEDGEMAEPGPLGPRLLHPGFICAGATLLIAALATDAMYHSTALMPWANASAWLIAAGLVLALVAAILLVVDLATGRAGPIRWLQFVLVAAAALAVSACSKNEAAENTMNVDENLVTENVAANDTMAVDAANTTDANMAMDANATDANATDVNAADANTTNAQ